MIPPAPIEPSANVLVWRYVHRLTQDQGALERHIDRFLRVQERAARAEKRAAILAARGRPRPPA